MPTFVLRQIDPDLWHRFKRQADHDNLRLLQAMLLLVQGYAEGTITLKTPDRVLTEEETARWTRPGREGEAFRAEVFHAINETANTGEFATVYSHDGIVLDAWHVPP